VPEPDTEREDTLSSLVAIADAEESTAKEVGRALVELQKEHSTSLSNEAEQTLQEALVKGAAAQ
jgi:uncharacterized membrane protein